MLWDSAVRCLLNGTAKTSFLKQYLIENSLMTQIWRRILFFDRKPNFSNIQRTWRRFKDKNVILGLKITLELITILEPRSNFEANPQFWVHHSSGLANLPQMLIPLFVSQHYDHELAVLIWEIWAPGLVLYMINCIDYTPP